MTNPIVTYQCTEGSAPEVRTNLVGVTNLGQESAEGSPPGARKDDVTVSPPGATKDDVEGSPPGCCKELSWSGQQGGRKNPTLSCVIIA